MDKQELADSFKQFRDVCLKNAEDLLVAAKAALDAGVDHAAFHMTVLVLEEVGKIEMELIRVMSTLHPSREPMRYRLDTEDHERKLFFAFWGPSLAREKQTKQLIDTNLRLAKNLHRNRLLYLYADPGNPRHWKDLMKEGEARTTFGLAEARLRLAAASGGLQPEHFEEPDEDLGWFLEVQENERKRKEIWGHKSQEKLLELGNVRAWIKWLREVYEENEQQVREAVQREMQRQQPSEEERLDPKWRVSVEIGAPSHSIRQNHLDKFNQHSKWIKLKRKDVHTLGVDFTLSKSASIHGLWWHAWGIARSFAVALTVATHGFFWWNLSRDPSRYYKEIWDLDADMGVDLHPSEELQRDWKSKRWVLKDVDLTMTSLIFSYLGHCHAEDKEQHLNHYVAGLSFLAKSDIHLRLEMNAFDEFFKALRLAMTENGDWDQEQRFDEAYLKATEWREFTKMPPKVVEDMKQLFALGFKVEAEHKGKVNLSAVYGIKEYCEIYLQTLAVRYLEQKEGAKVRIELGSNEEE